MPNPTAETVSIRRSAKANNETIFLVSDEAPISTTATMYKVQSVYGDIMYSQRKVDITQPLVFLNSKTDTVQIDDDTDLDKLPVYITFI